MSKLPNIETDFAQWYQDIIYQAEIADKSPVRGSIVIRPYGYEIWELIKDPLNLKIKQTGHKNAAFPLLIPESFLKKEAKHVEGFAPEVVVVTHAGGKKLEEPLVIRPTSETIIHYMFAKWIKSWRDLPLKINQWANIVRWELRPRPFIRTTEIFWQEGHTAHATEQEAETEAITMLEVYIDLLQNYMAIPVVQGVKSESEKFPGAIKTFTVETLMPDGKALQMCTSHILSQSFAKSFDMSFQDQNGETAYPHLTSWGLTTRTVGATIMVHGDQKGLVLPPRVAPIQVVIIPIFKKNADENKVLGVVSEIFEQLKDNVRLHIDDDRQKTPGAKFYHWELKGVPIRLEIGPRDIEKNQAVLVDRLGTKKIVDLDSIKQEIDDLLHNLQNELFLRAKKRLESNWKKSPKLKEFGPSMAEHGGFFQTGWCQSPECEQKLKDFKGFTRCILKEKTFEQCFNCNKPNVLDVLVAKAY